MHAPESVSRVAAQAFGTRVLVLLIVLVGGLPVRADVVVTLGRRQRDGAPRTMASGIPYVVTFEASGKGRGWKWPQEVESVSTAGVAQSAFALPGAYTRRD